MQGTGQGDAMDGAKLVLSLELADPASRAHARQLVESFGPAGISAEKARLLDRRISQLAQADLGGSRLAQDLRRLAECLDRLGPAPNTLASRLFGFGRRRAEGLYAMREEVADAVSSLSKAAEVLRQNAVALDRYEEDVAQECQRARQEASRADGFAQELSAGIEEARRAGASPEVLRFAERELYAPLLQNCQQLQALLAVNQQAALAIAILKETNDALLGNVGLVSVAARAALELASAQHRKAEAGAQPAEGDEAEMPELDRSLAELSAALGQHEALRHGADVQVGGSVAELHRLSGELSDIAD